MSCSKELTTNFDSFTKEKSNLVITEDFDFRSVPGMLPQGFAVAHVRHAIL